MWNTRDIFVVPSWQVIHVAGEDTVLSVSPTVPRKRHWGFGGNKVSAIQHLAFNQYFVMKVYNFK
jgi:hypothetical protein